MNDNSKAPGGNGRREIGPLRKGGRGRGKRWQSLPRVWHSPTRGDIPLGNVAGRGLTLADFGVVTRNRRMSEDESAE